jgi:putative transposase
MLVSTSAFYAWTKAPEETDKKGQQKQLEAKAIQLFHENKQVYGSRRLAKAFIKEDIQVGRYKARQLIKKLGLKPRYPKRFKVTTDSNHADAIAPNHLNRQFDVTAPNKV